MQPNWKTLNIHIDYGYEGSHPAVEITCYAAGRLHFKNRLDGSGLPVYQQVQDKEHRLSPLELKHLNELLGELILQQPQRSINHGVVDGNSFSCSLLLENGARMKWSHYGGFPQAGMQKLECELRQLLGEELFLEKHAGTWYQDPDHPGEASVN